MRGEPTTLGRPGTIDDTAEELTARGGTGIAVRCDHTDDAQVVALFERIRRDRRRLDLLVNNAWSGYEISPDSSLPFWEIEWRHWDLMFDGGLRAAAFASTLAAPMMIEASSGLIVNNPPMRMLPPARRPNHWFFDGWSCVREQLESAGVPGDQIFNADLCTASHEAVFCSYRRDGAIAGRMAGVIRPRPWPR